MKISIIQTISIPLAEEGSREIAMECVRQAVENNTLVGFDIYQGKYYGIGTAMDYDTETGEYSAQEENK